MSIGVHQRENLAGFDPRTLPGLEAWYDGLAPNGLQPAGYTPGINLARYSYSCDPAPTYSQAYFRLSPNSFGTGGSGTTVTTPGSGIAGGPDAFARKTWTTVGSAFDISFYFSGYVPAAQGDKYSVSFKWRSSWATNATINAIYVYEIDANFNTVVSGIVMTTASPAANTWQTLSGSYTITNPNTKTIVIGHVLYCGTGPSVGSTLDGTALMVAPGTTVPTYSDGNYPGWKWDGAPGASTSRTDVAVDNTAMSQWNDLSGKNRHLLSSLAQRPLWREANVNLLPLSIAVPTAWAAEQPSATVTNNSTDQTAHGSAVKCVMAGTTAYEGCYSPSAFNAVKGTTYTLSAWVYYSGAAKFFRFLLYGGSSVAMVSGVSHSGGGWQRVSFTAASLADQTACSVYIDSGGTPFAATFYVAQVQLEIGTVATSWLPPNNKAGVQMDGSSAATQSIMATTGGFRMNLGAVPCTMYVCVTHFAVNNYISSANGQIPFICYDGPSPAKSNYLIVYASGSNFCGYTITGGSSIGDSVNSLNKNSPSVFAGVTVPLTSVAVEVNGNALVSTASSNTSGLDAGLQIGYNGQPFCGIIHEVLLFSKAHDKATRRRIENWLAARYAVPLIRP